jgi:hypothetical protein
MVKAVEKYHDSPRAYEDKVTLVAHGFTLHLRAAVDIHAAENPHSQGEQYAKHILTAAGPGLEALAQTAAERLHDPTHLHEHESAMDALVGHVRANYYEAWVQPVVKVLNHLGIHV